MNKRNLKKQECDNCHVFGTIVVEKNGELHCEYCAWGDPETWWVAGMFNILENNLIELLGGEQ